MKVSSLLRAKEFILMAVILLIGAFFRFYRMRDYLVFLGDEGRDVLVVKRIIVDHAFTLLGPITSVGGMYLGPIYYYFMAPFLWLFHLDPVGPAIMVGLLGLSTIYLVYRTGKDFINIEAGIFAALLYSTSPLTIIYSRSSWNPNAVPFFGLLIIYSLLQIVVRHNFRYVFILGLAFGAVIQLHYLALVFGGLFLAVFFWQRQIVTFQRLSLFITGFISTFWPFLLFEFRHAFPITTTILRFITKRGGDATFQLSTFLPRLSDITMRLFWRLLIVSNSEITKVVLIALGLCCVFYITRKKYAPYIKQTMFILSLWLGIGLISYAFYSGSLYDYYFVPLFPLPFLIFGAVTSTVWKHSLWGRLATIGVLLFLLSTYMVHSPFHQQPNKLLDQTQTIAHVAYMLTDGKPYNFALVSSGNSDHAYRYFFEFWGNKPIPIENDSVDPERKTVTGQLIVICEDKKCQPLGHPLWEIAGFGRADVAAQYDIVNVKILRLVHYQEV